MSIEKLGPPGDELYRLIGESLEGTEVYAVGRDTIQEDGFGTFMRLFENPAGQAVMPTVGLLATILDGKTDVTQTISKHILPAVRVPLNIERTLNVLQYLANQHERSAGQDRKLYLETFNVFLKEGLEQNEFAAQLRPLRFLNQENRWCSPDILAASGDNIAPSNLIHRSHLQELVEAGYWSSNEGQQSSGANESAMDGSRFDPNKLATKCSAARGNICRLGETMRFPTTPWPPSSPCLVIATAFQIYTNNSATLAPWMRCVSNFRGLLSSLTD